MIVVGTFRDASDGYRKSVQVKFLPESNPQPDGLGVLTAIVLAVQTNDLGAISIVLEQGLYLVEVGTLPRDRFFIAVPDSAATADITTLMVAEDLSLPSITQQGDNFRIKNGNLQLKNIDTNLFHTIRLVGLPGAEQIEIVIPGEA